MPDENSPALPYHPDLEPFVNPQEPIWESFHREVARWKAAPVDVFFLAFLRRLERFGYFTLGPITIDVRLIEDIVARTVRPEKQDPPPLRDDMARFSRVLAAEVQGSGRRQVDDLHVLIALMRFNEGLPGRVFGEMGVTPEQVEEYVRGGGRQPAPADEKLYSPEEAAEYLGVHVQTVRGWIRSGRLRASRLAGQRALRIRSSDLSSVLEPITPGDPDH